MPIRPINARPKTQSVSVTSTSLTSNPNVDWKLTKTSDSPVGISMIADFVRESIGSRLADPGCLFSNSLNSPVAIADPVANTSASTVIAKDKMRIFCSFLSSPNNVQRFSPAAGLKGGQSNRKRNITVHRRERRER